VEYDVFINGIAIRVTKDTANSIIFEMQSGRHTLITFEDLGKQRHVASPTKIDRISAIAPVAAPR